MNGLCTVCKRELKGYFSTPVAYVFLVIFLAAAGYMTFKAGFYEMRQADMRLFFNNLPTLFIFLVPCTAMRLWAEERKTGSIELLLTLPIKVSQAVVGKFIAAWIFLGIALALTFPMPATVGYLGDPDWGPIWGGYIASFLLAGSYLAVGCFFSALTKNQVISFILAVAACAVLYFLGLPSSLNALAGFLPLAVINLLETLSYQNHFEGLMRGILTFKDIAFFLLSIMGWVAACNIILEERKAA